MLLNERVMWLPVTMLCAISVCACHASGNDGARSRLSEEVNAWWTGDSAIPQIGTENWPAARLGPMPEYSALPAASQGLRQQLAAEGLTFAGNFTAYFFGNPSGGRAQGFAYNSMLFMQLQLDLEKIVGWHGAEFVWSFADNNGSNLSETIGNNFQIIAEYGPNTFVFSDFYLKQKFFDDALQIKVGQLSALNNFAAHELYSYYANLALNGNALPLAFDGGATTLPRSSWGAHVLFTQPQWYVQSGVYQLSDRIGVNSYHGLNYTIEPGDGAIVFGETGWTPVFGRTDAQPGLPGHYKVGGYFSGWNYENYRGGANTSNLYAFYLLFDQMVYRERDNGGDGVYLWTAFTFTPQEDMAQIPYFVSGGGQYVGLFPGRDEDRLVFGAGYGSYSGDLRAQQESQGQAPEFYELVFECSYQIAINKWMWIQPDVQYIVNPGATGNLPNAWVLGMIVNVGF